jgi:hypothetical protein
VSGLLLLLLCQGAWAAEEEDAAAAAARDAAPLPRYLSVTELRQPLLTGLPALAACPGFAAAPDGSVELRWRIAPSGEPVDLQLSGPMLGSDDVAACVRLRFLELRFPEHDEVGESVRAVVAKQADAFLPFVDVQIEPRSIGPLFLKFPRELNSADLSTWALGLGSMASDRAVAPPSP